MGFSLSRQIKDTLNQHKKDNKNKAILGIAAAFVMVVTVFFMMHPVSTATPELTCGKEEHIHSSECYEETEVLDCNKEESEGHTHTEDCYDEDGNLTCGLEESEGHQHDDSCYKTEKTLICGEKEHEHTEICYEKGGTLKSQTKDKMTAAVTYEAGVIHEGTTLSAKAAKEDAVKDIREEIENEIALEDKTLSVFQAYDLTLSKDEVEVEPEAGETVDVKLTFNNKVETEDKNTEWKLYHVIRDEDTDTYQLEEITEEYNKLSIKTDSNNAVKSITFETDGFSEYVLVGVAQKAEEQETEDATESTTEDLSAEEQTTAEEKENKEDAISGEDKKDAAEEGTTSSEKKEDTDKSADAEGKTTEKNGQSYKATVSGLSVLVSAEEGTFPDGTTMHVEKVTKKSVLNAARDAVSEGDTDADSKKAEAERMGLQSTEDKMEYTGSSAKVQAIDITFLNADGKEIEPKKAVRVTMQSEDLADTDAVTVVHVDDKLKTEIIEQISEKEVKAEEDEVIFDADEFSTYVLVYTVDFYSGDYEYHLNGGGSILLSELISNLNIAKNDQGDIVAINEISDVSFSNSKLLKVTKLKDDWQLDSLKAFKTQEILSIILKDETVITVLVTDDAVSGIDFSQYISSISVSYRDNNGNWQQAGADYKYTSGDGINVAMRYTIPLGIVKYREGDETARTIYYQLPDGVRPIEANSGRITTTDSAGKTVEAGSYTLEENGLIKIVFDEDYVKELENGLSGEFHFEGTVENSSSEKEKTISFPGSGTTITVVTAEEETYDIHTYKTGSLVSDSSNKAHYTITASSIKGTDDKTVDIEDIVTLRGNITASYSSVTVIKVDASGNRTSVNSYQQSIDNGSFKITGLPALNANEKYEVSYDLDVSGADNGFTIDNKASSSTGEHIDWSSRNITVPKDVEKSGSYDADTNTITWTITVNQNYKDISGWRITDTTEGEIVGNISISGNNYPKYTVDIEATGSNTIDYTFPTSWEYDNQKTDCYTITYKTQAPSKSDGQTSFSQDNTVNVDKGNGKTDTSTGTVTGNYRTWNVSKEYNAGNSAAKTTSVYENYWKSTVTLPEGNLTSFVYTDTIQNAYLLGVDMNPTEDQGSDSHYGLAENMENDFDGNLAIIVNDHQSYVYHSDSSVHFIDTDENTDEKTSDISIKITYYDKDGNEISNPAQNHDTKVKSFKIVVTPAEGKAINALRMVLDYSTLTDFGSNQNVTWYVSNTANTNQGTNPSTASTTIRVPAKLVKSLYTETLNGADVYKSGSVDVDYQDGSLTYRILLETSSDDNGKDIVVSDDLPAYMKYQDESAYARFFLTAYDQHTKNYVGVDLASSDSFEIKTEDVISESGETTSQKLTFTISNYVYSPSYPSIAIYYKVDISEDPIWDELKDNGKEYSNTVMWGDESSTQDTYVKRVLDNIYKDGEQTTPGKIDYYIDINPKAEQLSLEDNGILELTDQLQWASDFNPVFDLSSLKLYAYDSTKEHHMGTELSSDLIYQLTYDQTNSKVTVRIPDKMACVLVYSYSIDSSKTGTITNNATLEGKWAVSESTAVKTSSSGGSVTTNALNFYKVDSDDYTKTLSGVKFQLSRWNKLTSKWQIYNKNTNKWEDENSQSGDSYELVTENGRLHWNVKPDEYNSDGTLKEITEDERYSEDAGSYVIMDDVLYRLIEVDVNTDVNPEYTNPATGYSPYYFVHMFNDSNKNSESSITGGGNVSNLDWSKVQLFQHNGIGSMFIPNKAVAVGVEKVWTAHDGTKLDNHPDHVDVQLYEQEYVLEDGVSVKVTTQGVDVDYGNNKTYRQPDVVTGPKTIGQGSNLEIYFWASQGYDSVYEYTMNGNKYTGTITADSSGKYSLIISNITEDLDVTIVHKNQSYPVTVNFDNYTEPQEVLSEASLVDTKSLNENNDWKYVWTGLDSTKYYTVKEIELSGYTTTYNNNKGIQSGTITITNIKDKPDESEIALPKTGGSGFHDSKGWFITFMIAAMFTALFLELKRRLREGRDSV